MKQGNRKYQTSPAVCNRTFNSMLFLNLSPINAKLKPVLHESVSSAANQLQSTSADFRCLFVGCTHLMLVSGEGYKSKLI